MSAQATYINRIVRSMHSAAQLLGQRVTIRTIRRV